MERDAVRLREGDEWLEADGLGGFAMGTASGVRTRRYHGLLTAAATPPTGRRALVAALEVEVDVGAGRRALSTHRYHPGVLHPDGHTRLVGFHAEPAPRRIFRLDGGARVVETVVVPRGQAAVVVAFALDGPAPGARVFVRPLLAMRDVHALRRRTDDVRPGAYVASDAPGEVSRVDWAPVAGEPTVACRFTGKYRHEPLWYRDFVYEEERRRGYDDTEDLFSPGELELDLSDGAAHVMFHALVPGAGAPTTGFDVEPRAWFEREIARRSALPSALDRAAESYLVRRGTGATVVAGYPWFADWGRDSFIALRGLCLARGELQAAGEVLEAWAEVVSSGMLPNRFVDSTELPEYNAVDASLWFVVAVGELLDTCARAGASVAEPRRRLLSGATRAILEGYATGARHGIRMDSDGLLAAGEPGVQLTWMDAKVDGRVITPRIGKPVEVQALWANALAVGAREEARWADLLERVRSAFTARFWDPQLGYLCDVVDVDHVPGRCDRTLRPNQVLAVGGLPLALVRGSMATAIVETLERELVTPVGLRTLPRGHADYRGRYAGGPVERDEAYHQGTVWPWLLGPFVEAWVRARGNDDAARRDARARFLAPFREHLRVAGLGHVSELFDGDAPHGPGGCPFQAWSLGELLRLERVVLAERDREGARPAERHVPSPKRGS